MAKHEHQCCARVYGAGQWGAFHPHQCPRSGTIERAGKWYCKQHDPEAVKARSEERSARWERESSVKREIERTQENATRRDERRKVLGAVLKIVAAEDYAADVEDRINSLFPDDCWEVQE